MKIFVEPPHQMEAEKIAVDAKTGAVEIEPRITRSQSAIRVGYLRAVGDNGIEVGASLLFNAALGKFYLQPTGRTPRLSPCAFDLPPAEFEQRRANKKKKKPAPFVGPPPPLVPPGSK